jgi:hypothetical protein
MPNASAALKLAGQVTPFVEIVNVRLKRLSGEAFPDEDPDAKHKARFRDPQSLGYRVGEAGVVVEVQFEMEGFQEREEERKLVELSAVFQLSYRLTGDFNPTPEQLKAFSEINAPYNAWPYWRELVHSTILKMGLPPLIAPVYRIPRANPPKDQAQKKDGVEQTRAEDPDAGKREG